MHYSHEIDITTAHTVNAPLEQLLKFTAGKLKGVDILFEVGDGYSSRTLFFIQFFPYPA
jgi:hypothetical protein